MIKVGIIKVNTACWRPAGTIRFTQNTNMERAGLFASCCDLILTPEMDEMMEKKKMEDLLKGERRSALTSEIWI